MMTLEIARGAIPDNCSLPKAKKRGGVPRFLVLNERGRWTPPGDSIFRRKSQHCAGLCRRCHLDAEFGEDATQLFNLGRI